MGPGWAGQEEVTTVAAVSWLQNQNLRHTPDWLMLGQVPKPQVNRKANLWHYRAVHYIALDTQRQVWRFCTVSVSLSWNHLSRDVPWPFEG